MGDCKHNINHNPRKDPEYGISNWLRHPFRCDPDCLPCASDFRDIKLEFSFCTSYFFPHTVDREGTDEKKEG